MQSILEKRELLGEEELQKRQEKGELMEKVKAPSAGEGNLRPYSRAGTLLWDRQGEGRAIWEQSEFTTRRPSQTGEGVARKKGKLDSDESTESENEDLSEKGKKESVRK